MLQDPGGVVGSDGGVQRLQNLAGVIVGGEDRLGNDPAGHLGNLAGIEPIVLEAVVHEAGDLVFDDRGTRRQGGEQRQHQANCGV